MLSLSFIINVENFPYNTRTSIISRKNIKKNCQKVEKRQKTLCHTVSLRHTVTLAQCHAVTHCHAVTLTLCHTVTLKNPPKKQENVKNKAEKG